eukprot:scaffold37028_cov57-Attheya_sp.AAC.7
MHFSFSLHVAIRRAFSLVLGKHMTTQAYMEMFQNVIDVVDHTSGSFGVTTSGNKYAVLLIHGTELEFVMDKDDLANVKKVAREMNLATAFFLGADKFRFGRLIEDTENSFLQGTNKYPKTLQAAYNLLSNYRQESCRSVGLAPYSDVVSFNTNGNEGDDAAPKEPSVALATSGFKPVSKMLMAGLESGEFDSSTSFTFNTNGMVEKLPHTGVTLKISQGGEVPKSWILLDNQSTVDVFHNKDHLKNICKNETSMVIHCNTGVTRTNLVGDVEDYGTVCWYHPNSIANILLLSKVKKNAYRITYNSKNGNECTVQKSDGSVRIFCESPRGLFYMDTEAKTGIMLIN